MEIRHSRRSFPNNTCNSSSTGFDVVAGRITSFFVQPTDELCEGAEDGPVVYQAISTTVMGSEPTINVSADFTTLRSRRGSKIYLFPRRR